MKKFILSLALVFGICAASFAENNFNKESKIIKKTSTKIDKIFYDDLEMVQYRLWASYDGGATWTLVYSWFTFE